MKPTHQPAPGWGVYVTQDHPRYRVQVAPADADGETGHLLYGSCPCKPHWDKTCKVWVHEDVPILFNFPRAQIGEGKFYTEEDICEILAKADALGYSLEKGSFLEKMTLAEVERLVTLKH